MAPKLPPVDQSYAIIGQVANPRDVEAYLAAEAMKALGTQSAGLSYRLIRLALKLPLRRLANMAVEFDRRVASDGFQEAARWVLPHFIRRIRVEGIENIPRQGPVVIASNHPGTFDSLAIIANLPRPDINVVLAANPFFRVFQHARQNFIYSTLDPHARMAVVRSAVRHLQQGGVLVIFATGKLDPDPAYFIEGARQAVERWSSSLAYLLRKVPETRLVPVAAGNFVARSCLDSPVTWIHRTSTERQKLAEFIQVIQQLLFGLRFGNIPRLSFGPAISPAIDYSPEKPQLGSGSHDNDMQAIRQAALHLLEAAYP